MLTLTPEGQAAIDDIAARHGLSVEAVGVLAKALSLGGGMQAQFNHPELGGMGQWSPGMIMIGDMFNNGLKARIEGVMIELQQKMRAQPFFAYENAAAASSGFGGGASSWWGPGLGMPSAIGGQNDMRYAYFPATSRLAVDQNGQLTVYDVGDTVIWGFSQQQPGIGGLSFTTNRGQIGIDSFTAIGAAAGAASASASAQATAPAPVQTPPAPAPQTASPQALQPVQAQQAPQAAQVGDPGRLPDFAAILEQLADLHKKGILSAEEFAAKKAEILRRI